MQQSALLTLYFVPKLYKLDFDIQKNDFDIWFRVSIAGRYEFNSVEVVCGYWGIQQTYPRLHKRLNAIAVTIIVTLFNHYAHMDWESIYTVSSNRTLPPTRTIHAYTVAESFQFVGIHVLRFALDTVWLCVIIYSNTVGGLLFFPGRNLEL
jgi:hypothetical protein